MGCGSSTFQEQNKEIKEEEQKQKALNSAAPAGDEVEEGTPRPKDKGDKVEKDVTVVDTDDLENKAKEKKPADPTSKVGPSASGSERSIPGSYLTDEEEEAIKDWLKHVDMEQRIPLENGPAESSK
uniref:Uncharacterized protein n=1 Tax=Eutreptiella gymnastica TaxID=73025 RepID=A0A7S1N9Q9_9EUGL|mmetsp:Transcript_142438/g.248453  ORF Transcript_142438/g.248453 Transcript_142438/m.248453 type:complete len:126 (+) Transcript_142438:118-495(+)